MYIGNFTLEIRIIQLNSLKIETIIKNLIEE